MKIIGDPSLLDKIISTIPFPEYPDFSKHIMDKIPKNLDECFQELTKILIVEKLTSGFDFKDEDEEDIIFQTHHTFGRAMRNSWKLWEDNELTIFFHNLGVFHADDISGIILTSLHRHLNGKDIKLEEQVKYYINYWKNRGYKDGNPTNDIDMTLEGYFNS